MILCVIPARGGSKRIKNKNIKNFLGKPVISYPIKQIIKSNIFDKIIVSTDSQKIAEIAKKYGAEILFNRPKKLSNDYVDVQSVISHAVNWIKNNISQIKDVCCVYPATPLIESKNIVDAYKIYKKKKWDFVFAASKFYYPIQRAVFQKKNQSIKMYNEKNYNKRSQDLIPSYHDAGQFCWGRANAWISKKKIFSSKTTIFKLDKFSSHDIDNLEDWEICEKLYKIKFK